MFDMIYMYVYYNTGAVTWGAETASVRGGGGSEETRWDGEIQGCWENTRGNYIPESHTMINFTELKLPT